MTKINVLTDCGNSPKNTFIRDFNIAFAAGDLAKLSAMVSDDVTWEIIGDNIYSGKHTFIAAVEKMKCQELLEFTLDTAVSHGTTASASGSMVIKNGIQFLFSDVYEFSSVKGDQIKVIKSYVISV